MILKLPAGGAPLVGSSCNEIAIQAEQFEKANELFIGESALPNIRHSPDG